jgi:hypothetical protein
VALTYTKSGRVDGRCSRYVVDDRAHRTPEQIAELEACYQSVLLARGNRAKGLLMVKLRSRGWSWARTVDGMRQRKDVGI